MANDTSTRDRLEKKLDLIIHLLCLMVDVNNTPPIGYQIAMLKEHGLAPAEIGKIVGREANYVSASLRSKRNG
jgi:hypothetical protein